MLGFGREWLLSELRDAFRAAVLPEARSSSLAASAKRSESAMERGEAPGLFAGGARPTMGGGAAAAALAALAAGSGPECQEELVGRCGGVL